MIEQWISAVGSLVLACVIMLMGISVMTTGAFGRKMDPFFLPRKVGRLFHKITFKTCRGVAKGFKRVSYHVRSFGRRPGQPRWVTILCSVASVAPYVIGLLFQALTAVVGLGGKK